MKILVVEDDRRASEYLAKGLRELGHTVEQAFDGESGLKAAQTGVNDVLVLDRMLPKLDGLEIVRQLRAAGSTVPILILSALDEVDERVQGLRAGGDDYLAKPYHLEELAARLDALARRQAESGPAGKLRIADLELDSRARKVVRAGRKIDLTTREFQLLEFLMRHTGQVVTRTMILEGVWDYHFDPKTNVIDVHISRLRQAIDKGFESQLLHTVRGAGYTLSEDP
ncbi:MAG: response regulator transcription factor [Proteobacteria bacterium]|nr:response regulator transcription factor [Pseudomonadota bacterium]